MFVASESGGLFKTSDSGIHWSHVDLAAYYTSAVAYVTSDILLATTTDWFSTANDGGGIWRSSDGGITWSHIANPVPPPGAAWRFKANEISIAPDTGDIYVATSFGVSKSTDQGLTWILELPFDGFEASSVAAQVGGLVIASTFDSRASIKNVARSEDGGATWLATTFPVSFGSNELHGLAISPLDAKTFYAYGDPDFYVSEDGGTTWSKIATDFSRHPEDMCGGNGFVKPLATPPGLTLWLGNRCHVAQLVAPQIPGTSHFNYSAPVTFSTVDHWDSRDMALTTHTPRMPVLLASDGGVHRTLDGGRSWTLTGSGPNGYNALQIAEVKGQWIDNSARYDLYIAVQDNGLWASGDAGLTWPSTFGGEGDFIEMQKHVPSAADSVVTANACGPCTNVVGGAVFSKTYGAQFDGAQPWPDPAGPVVGHPAIISKSFHDQGAIFPSSRRPLLPYPGIAATHDLGLSWTQYAPVRESLRDIPKLSKIGIPPQNVIVPVQYQAIKTGFDASQNFEIVQLVRLVAPSSPSKSANVYYPAMHGFGSIGIAPPWWSWYHVFAVDPKDSQHLIAPDASDGTIRESHDGGDYWSEIAGLKSLITDGGRFQGGFWVFPFASHVSFSSDDPNSVAIGTQQNGLFVSRDRGATWSKVPDSERATAITSVEWMSATEAFVSTLGRGLWKLSGNVHVRSTPELCVVQSCLLRYIDKGDPAPDRFQRGIIVFDGEIMGARVEEGVLRELSVTPQTSIGFVGTPVKFTAHYTNKRVGVVGTGTDKTFAPRDGRLLTGIAVDKRGGVFGALYTSKTIPLSGRSEKRQGVKTADARLILRQNHSPSLSKPYISLSVAGKQTDDIEPEDPVTVVGERIPGDVAFEIVLDRRPIQKIKADGSGFLKAVIKAPKELGPHTLVVRDASSGRPIDGTMFVIHHRDVKRE
jgi:photosystem II stability/assembly factor-like uncharacterized protein